jgi:ABC-type antimicrobial peptide transport system permease subunit
VTVDPLLDRVVRRVAPTLWILLGTVALLLLVAGANVANLFLVRAESRQREIAVRAALGASRGRIAGTFLAESVVLAVTGGSMGVLLAAAGTRLLVARGPAQLPRLHEVSMDARVFLFAAALSALTALALGMLPSVRFARRSFATAIREPAAASPPDGIVTGSGSCSSWRKSPWRSCCSSLPG